MFVDFNSYPITNGFVNLDGVLRINVTLTILFVYIKPTT